MEVNELSITWMQPKSRYINKLINKLFSKFSKKDDLIDYTVQSHRILTS